jgi:hypothetical protein
MYNKGFRLRQGNFCLRELKNGTLSSSHDDCENCKFLISCHDPTAKIIYANYRCPYCNYKGVEVKYKGKFFHKDCLGKLKKQLKPQG